MTSLCRSFPANTTGRLARLALMATVIGSMAALAQSPTVLPPLQDAGFIAPAPVLDAPATSSPLPSAAPAPSTLPVADPNAPIAQTLPATIPAFGPAPIGITGRRTSMRDVFVGTLAVAATATGTQLMVDLAQAVSGGLIGWFGRRMGGGGGAPVGTSLTTTPNVFATAAPSGTPTPIAPSSEIPISTLPAASPPATLEMSSSSAAPAPLGSPAPIALGSPAPLQFFDAQSRIPATADPVLLQAANSAGENSLLFAGLAYEVHAVDAVGSSLAVNPALHEFRTGDRFVVLYRPTLPGQMQVYNVNPAGRRTQIDSLQLAGGELARLGPYEFAAMTGEEHLQLVLTPCSTPELTVATRDIVKASSTSNFAARPGLSLVSCGIGATRSIDAPVTRDIRKVAVEGTTAFALDPVSAEERASGQLAPREVMIGFHHR